MSKRLHLHGTSLFCGQLLYPLCSCSVPAGSVMHRRWQQQFSFNMTFLHLGYEDACLTLCKKAGRLQHCHKRNTSCRGAHQAESQTSNYSITALVLSDLCTPIAHWVPGAVGLCATCTGSTMPLPQGAAAGGRAGAADQDSSCAGEGSLCLGPKRSHQTCRTAAVSCTGLRRGSAPLLCLPWGSMCQQHKHSAKQCASGHPLSGSVSRRLSHFETHHMTSRSHLVHLARLQQVLSVGPAFIPLLHPLLPSLNTAHRCMEDASFG